MTTGGGASGLYRYIGAFIAQLARSGVHHAVIAPGSRSTPLTLALDHHASIKTWLHLDERAAGYFALGLARQLNEPVVVVTTSGTASANLLPSVVEASLSRVPLIALTADRPPELRDIGANQTIDQTGLFGSHPRWAVELPVTDGSEALEGYARGIAARAVTTAAEAPAGPVHINVPLREPLIEAGWQRALDEGAATVPVDVSPNPIVPFERPPPRRPYAPVLTPKVTRPHEHARTAAARFVEMVLGRRGIIVCGPETDALPAEAIDNLAKTLGWPILADPLSGVRSGRHSMVRVIDAYDALLRSQRFSSRAAPEVVVRFGAAPTSKVLNQFLTSLDGVPQIVVDVAGGWRDPDAAASVMMRAEPRALCDAVVDALGARRPSAFTGAANDPARVGAPYHADPSWLQYWTSANHTARAALDKLLLDGSEPFEGYAPVALASAMRDVTTIILGNSMIIRDADSFLPVQPRALRFLGTRGASGIDGVVSTAVGAAAAGLGPVAALVGDLSFLHDLNGLWALRRHHLSLLVALVNNDGGGIFHFLPQADLAAGEFEEWFGTPHGLDFSGAIGTFGGRLVRPEPAEWMPALRGAASIPGLTVVELRTDRARNVALHREAWARVDSALRDAEAESTPPATAGAR